MRLRFSFWSSLLIFPMKIPLLTTLLLVVALVLPAFAAPKKIIAMKNFYFYLETSMKCVENMTKQPMSMILNALLSQWQQEVMN